MLTSLFLLVLLFITSPLLANPPEKIYPLEQVEKSIAYYRAQHLLWRDSFTNNPKAKKAWLYSYMAKRNELLLTKTSLEELQDIVESAQKAIPNSFELAYMDYLQASTKDKLEKAYALASKKDAPCLYPHFIEYYNCQGQKDQSILFCKKVRDEKTFSPGLLNWNHNVLASVDSGAVLLIQGKDANIPSLILQQAYEYRNDVTLINIDLCNSEVYLHQVSQKLAVQLSVNPHKSEFIQQLSQEVKAPLYFGLSIDQKLLTPWEQNLYLEGLAFRYSTQSYNHLKVLQEHYELRLHLDYLEQSFYKDISKTLIHKYNLNYLPSMILLYDHYLRQKKSSKAKRIKNLAKKIAKDSGNPQLLASFFSEQAPTTPQNLVEFNPRKVDEQMLQFGPQFFVSKVEVSNADFELFLLDLLKRKEYQKLKVCQSKAVDWQQWLPMSLQANGYDWKTDNKLTAPQYPLQNISHEAALLYCQWLTESYNNASNSYKKFKRVRFRLPTEKEWMYAAYGKEIPYLDQLAGIQNIDQLLQKDYLSNYQQIEQTWLEVQKASMPYLQKSWQNRRGCYSSNFQYAEANANVNCPQSKKPGKDGAVFTAHTLSFYPNDRGLYNVMGNVAEMLAQKGIAKGGSWFHQKEESLLFKQQSYNGPQPFVGFRVVMDVIEYKNEQSLSKKFHRPKQSIWVKDNVFIQQREVSNADWKTYLQALKLAKKEDVYQAALPHKAVFEQASISYADYFEGDNYEDYPVVGISHVQALNYCQWRSQQYNQQLLKKRKNIASRVAFRLPTAQEWEQAWEINQGEASFNLKNPLSLSTDFSIQSTDSQKDLLFAHLKGNVAEMLQAPGQAKGGSFRHVERESQVNSLIPYKRAKLWLGFRCAVEVFILK